LPLAIILRAFGASALGAENISRLALENILRAWRFGAWSPAKADSSHLYHKTERAGVL